MAKARFENLSAMFNAAKQISNGIAELHRSGYYFPDLSDGNICINPSNGDVLFDGTDNIVRFGEKTGILGKARYMAPEIVRGESTPDIYSDLFALSVILFLLILGNHPLEGLLISQITCMTETIEKELYGTNPLFIYDKNDVSNRPVQNLHNNVIKRWAVFPVILKEPFHKAFDKASMTVLSSCKNRITADEWVDVITSVQNSLVYCPSCKHKTFSENSECIMCGGKLS
jgi:serine/threonine protein kinase